jgi:hypothetical protein
MNLLPDTQLMNVSRLEHLFTLRNVISQRMTSFITYTSQVLELPGQCLPVAYTRNEESIVILAQNALYVPRRSKDSLITSKKKNAFILHETSISFIK